MLNNIFLKTLRDQRRAFLWWSIGLIGVDLIVILFYPSIQKLPEFNKYLEMAPKALLQAFIGEVSDLTSPEGYLNSQLFFFMVPLLFLFFTISFGSGATAVEEERKTLDILLSNPLSRSRIVFEKFTAMIVATLLLGFFFYLGLIIGALIVKLRISFSHLLAATLSGLLLSLAFGSLSLAIGCARGKRGLSIGISSAIGIASYLLNALAPLVEVLKPYRKLSLFYYYIGSDPLTNGLNLWHSAVLIGLVILFLVVALLVFERRNL